MDAFVKCVQTNSKTRDMSPQDTNHHRQIRSGRHRHRQQVILEMNRFKLESCQKIMYSVIFVIIIQMTQIRYSESTRHHQMKQSAHSQLFDADPIVFNPQSLYKTHERLRRSTSTVSAGQSPKFVDACQSRMEVLTPYYATNSKGKLRTIVNSELMQQAIQVETCARVEPDLIPSNIVRATTCSNQPQGERKLIKRMLNTLLTNHQLNCSPSQSTTSTPNSSSTNRCNAQPECGCEQKYKWHRLLVLDATDEESSSKGLFMDWFLFPSNCVCRCKSGANSTKHFLRTMVMTSKRQHQTE